MEKNEKRKILIIDDESLLNEFLEIAFKRLNFEVFTAKNISDGYNLFVRHMPESVVLDYKLPDGSGLELIPKLKKLKENTVIVLITAFGDNLIALSAMRAGAADFITKPFSAEQITTAIEKGLTKAGSVSNNGAASSKIHPVENSIIGECSELKHIYDIIGKIYSNDATVLITGESGTGKELIARYLHYNSSRNSFPFVTVNCNAIPDTLLESELFGHKKGAFTGANSDKIGLFEAADKGAIFLDEIGDISPALQVKLLRVIEDKKIMRIGSVESKQIDVRIIVATNKNLEMEVAKGNFREDLFYRINIIRTHLPALRERGNDIFLLANHFVQIFSAQYNKNLKGISEKALLNIKNYQWPGNVRELQNLLKRAVILTETEYLETENIFSGFSARPAPFEIEKKKNENIQSDENINIPDNGVDINSVLNEIEKKYICEALKKAHNNQSLAANYLKINRTTLIARMKKFDIT